MFVKETLIWLSGLISTDGCVSKNPKCNGVTIRISSTEDDWLEIMEKKLNSIGIKTSVIRATKFNVKSVYLHDAPFIINLLVHNNCQEWFIPRKWQRIIDNYQYYNSSNYVPRKRWTKEEEKLLMEGNIEELEKTREHQPIITKRHDMKRTKGAIRVKRQRLNKHSCSRKDECKSKYIELKKK